MKTAGGSFEVIGGKQLSGEITPQGAKNEALQVICATLLTAQKVVIKNVPDIVDVLILIEILQGLGAKVEKLDPHTYSFQTKEIDFAYLYEKEYAKKCSSLRGSMMLIGPILSRFKGDAVLPRPGGDKIGRRKIDTHLFALEKLGVRFSYNKEKEIVVFHGEGMHGTDIELEEASVTGTANAIMAAVLTKGTTTIYNAACEPYIQALCLMLNRMGAKISGIKSNYLTIEGVEELSGCEHEISPDMLEIGSFIGLAAMTQSAIMIKNVNQEMLGLAIPEAFRKLGITFDFYENGRLLVSGQHDYEITRTIEGGLLNIKAGIWPALTPDLLSIILVTATQAKGTILIHDWMYESRLFFTDKLIEMGAQIVLCDPHRATVTGLNRQTALRGIAMSSPDIRAGMALLIAALSAEGKSVIKEAGQIDRGYEQIDERLRTLGAEIKRV